MTIPEFRPLDVVLCATGCKIFIKNRYITCINVLLLLVTLADYLFAIIASFDQIQTDNKFAILTVLARFSDQLCGISFIWVIHRNREKIIRFLPQVMDNLSTRQRRSLWNHALVGALVVFLTIFQDVVYTLIHLSLLKSCPTFAHVAADFAKTYLYVNSWFVGGISVYTFFVKALMMTNENNFKNLIEKESFENENAHKLALHQRKLRTIRVKLLGTFSFIPVLWFFHLFVRATATSIEVCIKVT